MSSYGAGYLAVGLLAAIFSANYYIFGAIERVRAKTRRSIPVGILIGVGVFFLFTYSLTLAHPQ
jgi:hypothetical protein